MLQGLLKFFLEIIPSPFFIDIHLLHFYHLFIYYWTWISCSDSNQLEQKNWDVKSILRMTLSYIDSKKHQILVGSQGKKITDDGTYLKLILLHSVIKLWVGQSGEKKISLRNSQHIGFVWSGQAISSLFL